MNLYDLIKDDKKLLEIACEVASAQMHWNMLGMMNAPTEPAKIIEMSAAYATASDALKAVQDKYSYRLDELRREYVNQVHP